jgi:prevent-host-death family protein
MTVKTMTARDAKTHFGELLDTVQREPVIVTKNNRPVGIMISILDAADTLIPEMFMEKEEGYETWFQDKVAKTLRAVQDGTTTTSPHDEVMSQVWERLQAKAHAVSK